MDATLFTVCIRCASYNQERFILDAMDGFAHQETGFPFVAVIVDDASTDATPSIIRNYLADHFQVENVPVDTRVGTGGEVVYARHNENGDCHFAVVFLKENHYKRGYSIRPYVDVWADRSTYYAFCEGDDYWTDPFKLRKQVGFLDTHGDYVLCCTAFSQTFDGDELHKTDIIFKPEEITMDDLLEEYWIGSLTAVFKKSAIEGYRPPFEHLPMGDLPLWCHLATQGRIRYLFDVTANYRSLKDSACHFTDLRKEYAFEIEAMRVREYYAAKTGKLSIAQPFFAKTALFILDQCHKNDWKDFPKEKLWHFVKEYGAPSGYDKLKYWGLRSDLNHFISKLILRIKKKS